MGLSVKIVAKTQEIGNSNTDLFILGGKMAGVCYMAENYFDENIQNEDKAISRANLTSSSGHHSVFEHGSVTLQISGIPKIMAMLLNSTEQYTTSEKSARYTVMKPDTELERTIYEKWKSIFDTKIKEVYPDIDEKTRSKLALENARYMISVFTPTHMMWTVSYRQLAYIIEWLNTLSDKTSKLNGEFNKKVSVWCKELHNEIMNVIPECTVIKENKGREFEFMQYQNNGTQTEIKEYIGDIYQTTYLASFAQLAQLHRHRTIYYEFQFIGKDAMEYGVYVPTIIKDTEFEAEWLSDFKALAYCYPQGTLVKVLEQGRAVNYFNKCKERLCGRAQLEIANHEKEMLNNFIKHKDNLSANVRDKLKSITNSDKVCTKCCMEGIVCTEKCMWGALHGIDRLI